jgi:hypothetical protein
MLKRINIAESTAAKKETVPAFQTDLPLAEFNRLDAQLKDLEALKDELKAQILDIGLEKLFAHNLSASEKVDSVKLVNNGDAVRVSFQNVYRDANPDTATEIFEQLGKDINEFAHETVKVQINDKLFLDERGEFSVKIFNETVKALNAIARKYGKDGNFLTVKKLVQPKPDFHQQRWQEFATVEAQKLLQEALPARVMVVANVNA